MHPNSIVGHDAIEVEYNKPHVFHRVCTCSLPCFANTSLTMTPSSNDSAARRAALLLISLRSMTPLAKWLAAWVLILSIFDHKSVPSYGSLNPSNSQTP